MPSKRDLEALYKFYDTDKSGELDYKEFTAIICKNAGKPEPAAKKSEQFGKGLGHKEVGKGDSSTSNVNELLQKLKQKLAGRGARGIVGMGKQFRIMDDNNNRSLDMDEFTKAVNECRLGFGAAEIDVLFAAFDRNRDGSVDYDEFIRVLRGPMN